MRESDCHVVVVVAVVGNGFAELEWTGTANSMETAEIVMGMDPAGLNFDGIRLVTGEFRLSSIQNHQSEGRAGELFFSTVSVGVPAGDLSKMSSLVEIYGGQLWHR